MMHFRSFVGEITDHQESGRANGAMSSPSASHGADRSEVTDDAVATASSTPISTSHAVPEAPADVAGTKGDEASRLTVPADNSNPRPSSQAVIPPAKGAATGEAVAVKADASRLSSDDFDLVRDIPSFMRLTDKGCMAPSVEA